MSEEVKLPEPDELRKGIDSFMKGLSLIKFDIRSNPDEHDRLAQSVKDFAEKFDVFMWESFDRELFKRYRKFFDKYYDHEQAYKHTIMFHNSEYVVKGGDNMDKLKKYVNYLAKFMIMVNHLVMSMEFRLLHEQCLVEEKKD